MFKGNIYKSLDFICFKMAKILLSTIYAFEPVIASATKISADRLYLLIDKEPDDKQKESLKMIQQSLGSVLEIKTVETEIYDIYEVAKEAVKIIDILSDKDKIFIDITAGRKTKALGLLFGAYARGDRIQRIMYVKEETKQVMNLPKLTYSVTPGQIKIIEFLACHKIKSMADFAAQINISKSLLYQSIKDLKRMDIIEETSDGIKLTEYGRIVVL